MEFEQLFIGCLSTNTVRFRKFAKVSNVVNTSKIYNEILALPLFPTISKKHQDSVIKVIKSS